MHTIATLEALKARLGLTTATDDARLLAALQAATAQIERATGRRFAPYVAALAHDIDPLHPADLVLADDLLELTALADASGPLDTADVLLLPVEAPASVLWRSTGAAFQWQTTREQAVTVTGVWGWHDSPAQMWRATGDALAASLDATATTITVSATAAPDAAGEAPRFQTGHLLRCGDEFLRVLAVDPAAQTLTVLRGCNGTQPADHDAGASLASYQPPADLTMLCLRWAAWLYREPDHRLSGGIPASLSGSLHALRRVGV